MNNLPKSIKQKVDYIVELTRRIVTAIPDFQYHHTVFFITEDDQVQVMSPDLEGITKDETGDLIKEHAKRCKAAAVLQICEAYVVVSHETELESLSRQSLATHPDRQEMLVFSLETRDACYVSMVKIENNSRAFNNLAWHEQEVSGRFVGALRVPNHIH